MGSPEASSKSPSTVPVLAHSFVGISIAALAVLNWPWRWWLSGSPILTYILLLGQSNNTRVLPFVGTWTLVATLNLFYAVAATSWLLYWFFAGGCFAVMPIVCLFQFDYAAKSARRNLRSFLRSLHFLHDKVAFFDLPALEIDTDVDGLMVIRGITIHLSSLTIVAHGVEVGVKLSDDLELAMQVEEVRIPLFRRVEVGDVYANIKGGEYEMSFGQLAGDTKSPNGEAMMLDNSKMLKAARNKDDQGYFVKMTEKMTDGNAPEPITSPGAAIESVTTLPLDDAKAEEKYEETIRKIKRTNSIDLASYVVATTPTPSYDPNQYSFNFNSRKDLRPAVACSLHHRRTIAHPPAQSIRVTTLQTLGPPWVRHFLHRLPFLYRLLLNPISYFHPVNISSITAAASGLWIQHLLDEKVFYHEAETTDTRRLEKRISAWLTNADFAVEMTDIRGVAQVPILKGFDIISSLNFKDILAYRVLPSEVELKQVVRLGGADATVTVPSFLLPHHEHWLPGKLSKEDEEKMINDVKKEDGQPQQLQAEQELVRLRKDETTVKISAHAKLPACFDQELLNFISALVKATKLVEIEKEMSDTEANGDSEDTDDVAGDDESIASTMSSDTGKEKRTLKSLTKSWTGSEGKANLKSFAKDFNTSMKGKMRKTAMDAMINDRWIAKMVGKITRKLETAQGDIGYSAELPVPLGPYRERAEDGSKMLP